MTLELPDKIKHFRGLEIDQKLILEDCYIHIFDPTLNPEALDLCNMMGAMVTDSIIPFLTTHIVTNKMTQILKSTLSGIQSRAFETSSAIKSNNSSHLSGINQLLNIKIVKMDWLIESMK